MLAHPNFNGRHRWWETCHKVPRATGTDTQLPDPRAAWGQTLQLRQRTQADDPGLRFSHRTPRTLDTLSSTAGYLIESWVVADAGGSCHRDTQCQTHHEWYHTCLLVCFLQLTGTTKGPPSTTIGGRRASLEGFWEGTYANPQDHVQETHLPTRVEETWDVAWWTYMEGNARQPPW